MGYRRFVLVSHPRSGTHMLRTALESHPAIRCQSELFNTDDRRLPYPFSTPTREVLDGWAFREYPPTIQCVGFVLHAYHPLGLSLAPEIRQNPAWGDVWTILGSMPGLRVIRLSRRNLLRRHLSHLAARTTGRWHAWDAEDVHRVTHLAGLPPEAQIGAVPSQPPPLTLDPDRLEADFLDVVRARDRARRDLAALPSFDLDYEDLCNSFEGACHDVQEFLSVDPTLPLKPATGKLTQRPLAESIANYDALKRRFAGTAWAEFFED